MERNRCTAVFIPNRGEETTVSGDGIGSHYIMDQSERTYQANNTSSYKETQIYNPTAHKSDAVSRTISSLQRQHYGSSHTSSSSNSKPPISSRSSSIRQSQIDGAVRSGEVFNISDRTPTSINSSSSSNSNSQSQASRSNIVHQATEQSLPYSGTSSISISSKSTYDMNMSSGSSYQQPAMSMQGSNNSRSTTSIYNSSARPRRRVTVDSSCATSRSCLSSQHSNSRIPNSNNYIPQHLQQQPPPSQQQQRRRASLESMGCESRVDQYGRVSFYSDTTTSSTVAHDNSDSSMNSSEVNSLSVTSSQIRPTTTTTATGGNINPNNASGVRGVPRRRASMESSLGLPPPQQRVSSLRDDIPSSSRQQQTRRASVDTNSSFGLASSQSVKGAQKQQQRRRASMESGSISSYSSSLSRSSANPTVLSNRSNSTAAQTMHMGGRRHAPTTSIIAQNNNNNDSVQYPYQIEFTVQNQGKQISSSKRIIRIRFGYVNVNALLQGKKGVDARGEEHNIVVQWSITGGKRFILLDGNEVQYSVGKRGGSATAGNHVSQQRRRADVLEAAWQVNGHVYELKFYAYQPSVGSPEKRDPKWRQYTVNIDGRSYFELPNVLDLGKSQATYGIVGQQQLTVQQTRLTDPNSISLLSCSVNSTVNTGSSTKGDIQARINKQREQLNSKRKEAATNNNETKKQEVQYNPNTNAGFSRRASVISEAPSELIARSGTACVSSAHQQSGIHEEPDITSPGVNKFGFF